MLIFSGKCINGKLRAEEQRTADNQCGTCDASYELDKNTLTCVYDHTDTASRCVLGQRRAARLMAGGSNATVTCALITAAGAMATVAVGMQAGQAGEGLSDDGGDGCADHADRQPSAAARRYGNLS